MAGMYPNIPGHRFALDQDGTALYRISNDLATATDYSSMLTTISDTDDDYWEIYSEGTYTAAGRRIYIGLLFPEKRDITGYFTSLGGSNVGGFELQWSSDTTNCLDGTWTTDQPNFAWSGTTRPYYRLNISSVTWPAVRGVRFGHGRGVYSGSSYQSRIMTLHMYGSITAGQNLDRLRFWHGTNDAEILPHHFDFGNMSQGASKTIDFRVKNNSSTLTASGVAVTRSSASFPELTTGLEFSTDSGTTWVTSPNIGSLAPGAISSVINVRRTIAVDESIASPKDGRIQATAASWS